jgi:hypothetical protein
MTWEDIIQDCNKGIEQLQTFIVENPANADKYDEKLAILECFKQSALREQNATIQSALDQVAEDYHDRTGDRVSLAAHHTGDSSHLNSAGQEASTDGWIR